MIHLSKAGIGLLEYVDVTGPLNRLTPHLDGKQVGPVWPHPDTARVAPVGGSLFKSQTRSVWDGHGTAAPDRPPLAPPLAVSRQSVLAVPDRSRLGAFVERLFLVLALGVECWASSVK